MKHIILSILFLLSGIGLQAASNDSLMAAGNNYYDEGLYNDAITSYLEIFDHGYESASLYYNLGNAYFKLDDMPSAILYYEKAKKLDPNNEDILFNLNVANSKIPDKIEAVPELFYKRWWNSFYNMFSVNTWAQIAVGIFIVTLVCITLFFLSPYRMTRKLAFWFGIVFLTLTIFTFGLASQKYYYSKKHNEAIVFTPTITIKSSPNRNSVDLFVIHEGTKILIIDKLENWYEIRIANGSIGWLPAEAVKTI